jgi:hypothetical protein
VLGSAGDANPRVLVPLNVEVTIVSASSAGLEDTTCKLSSTDGALL